MTIIRLDPFQRLIDCGLISMLSLTGGSANIRLYKRWGRDSPPRDEGRGQGFLTSPGTFIFEDQATSRPYQSFLYKNGLIYGHTRTTAFVLDPATPEFLNYRILPWQEDPLGLGFSNPNTTEWFYGTKPRVLSDGRMVFLTNRRIFVMDEDLNVTTIMQVDDIVLGRSNFIRLRIAVKNPDYVYAVSPSTTQEDRNHVVVWNAVTGEPVQSYRTPAGNDLTYNILLDERSLLITAYSRWRDSDSPCLFPDVDHIRQLYWFEVDTLSGELLSCRWPTPGLVFPFITAFNGRIFYDDKNDDYILYTDIENSPGEPESLGKTFGIVRVDAETHEVKSVREAPYRDGSTFIRMRPVDIDSTADQFWSLRPSGTGTNYRSVDLTDMIPWDGLSSLFGVTLPNETITSISSGCTTAQEFPHSFLNFEADPDYAMYAGCFGPIAIINKRTGEWSSVGDRLWAVGPESPIRIISRPRDF